jgi:hypothetical protein
MMDVDERTTYLRIALAAQALLTRIDTLTTEEFAQGKDRKEREALRCALAGCTKGCWQHEED